MRCAFSEIGTLMAACSRAESCTTVSRSSLRTGARAMAKPPPSNRATMSPLRRAEQIRSALRAKTSVWAARPSRSSTWSMSSNCTTRQAVVLPETGSSSSTASSTATTWPRRPTPPSTSGRAAGGSDWRRAPLRAKAKGAASATNTNTRSPPNQKAARVMAGKNRIISGRRKNAGIARAGRASLAISCMNASPGRSRKMTPAGRS